MSAIRTNSHPRTRSIRLGVLLVAGLLVVGVGSVISAWALDDLDGWRGALDILVIGSGGFAVLAIWGYLATSPDGAQAELNRVLRRRPRDRH